MRSRVLSATWPFLTENPSFLISYLNPYEMPLGAVEIDPNCRRLLRRVHQGCELVNDITKFNKEAIIKVVDKIPALTGIVVGGGSPCQGLSKLSSNRKHLGDERSNNCSTRQSEFWRT